MSATTVLFLIVAGIAGGLGVLAGIAANYLTRGARRETLAFGGAALSLFVYGVLAMHELQNAFFHGLTASPIMPLLFTGILLASCVVLLWLVQRIRQLGVRARHR